MDSNLLFLIIIILIVFYISSEFNIKKSIKSNNSIILCLLILGLIIFFIYRDFNKTTESFYNKIYLKNRLNKRNNKNQVLGNYPSIFKTKCYNNNNNNKKVRFNLVNKSTIHSPIGTPHQLTEDISSSNFPSVDGKEGSAKHLFMFAKNQCRPECCPGTYSCDKGCICTTENQEKLLSSRGSNKNYNTNPNI